MFVYLPVCHHIFNSFVLVSFIANPSAISAVGLSGGFTYRYSVCSSSIYRQIRLPLELPREQLYAKPAADGLTIDICT